MIMHETLCQVYEMVFVLLGQGERLKHIGPSRTSSIVSVLAVTASTIIERNGSASNRTSSAIAINTFFIICFVFLVE